MEPNLFTPTRHGILRDRDFTGNGWYGASRGTRKHKGVDYICDPGNPIHACISGKVRIGNVYITTSKFKLVEITGVIYRVKEMYVTPCVKNGDYVTAGQIIGYSQNISLYHGNGMKNHCHVSLWKHGLLTDPEPILTPISNEKTFNYNGT